MSLRRGAQLLGSRLLQAQQGFTASSSVVPLAASRLGDVAGDSAASQWRGDSPAAVILPACLVRRHCCAGAQA